MGKWESEIKENEGEKPEKRRREICSMLVRRYSRRTAAPKWRVAKPHRSTTEDSRRESLRSLIPQGYFLSLSPILPYF